MLIGSQMLIGAMLLCSNSFEANTLGLVATANGLSTDPKPTLHWWGPKRPKHVSGVG